MERAFPPTEVSKLFPLDTIINARKTMDTIKKRKGLFMDIVYRILIKKLGLSPMKAKVPILLSSNAGLRANSRTLPC